ncbi:hypothetical protein GCM10012287_50680 [Streptomyces daqingensis]|uniref:Uncharacterized protein n=1 Tax=Streptomyces daqingensis TaxID=1472640 RepID=A0ABQ2MRN9_9ACTN|nr:hypothetical protein GCM10012287_50680 [Streptomyces daqingensis]
MRCVSRPSYGLDQRPCGREVLTGARRGAVDDAAHAGDGSVQPGPRGEVASHPLGSRSVHLRLGIGCRTRSGPRTTAEDPHGPPPLQQFGDDPPAKRACAACDQHRSGVLAHAPILRPPGAVRDTLAPHRVVPRAAGALRPAKPSGER